MTTPRDELARLVAYVFATQARRRIPEDDWVRMLSLERKWMPPSLARRLARAARTLGLLRNAGERDFEIGLEAEGVPLPLDYEPDVALLERVESEADHEAPPPGAPVPLFRRVARRLADALGESETDAVRRINATQAALGDLPTADVAALYVAALNGVDVSDLYEEADEALRARPLYAR